MVHRYRLLGLSFVCFMMLWIGNPGAVFGQNAFKVYINEVRADDSGVDDIEFIELIGPAGTYIGGFRIAHHNGASTVDGELWSYTIGDFIIPDDGVTDSQGNAMGFYVLGVNTNAAAVPNVDDTLTTENLQNGPDGIILYDALDNILDAVAWEGAGDLAVDDPGTVTTSPPTTANNYLHVTPDDDTGDNSLQAPDNVLGDDGNGWMVLAATPGALNGNQTSGDVTLPVQLTSFRAIAGNHKVTLRWITASEIDNLGFEVWKAFPGGDFSLLSSYQTNSELRGQLNSNTETRYAFIDRFVANGKTYRYKLVDVSVNGERTEHGPVSATPQASEVEVSTLDSDLPTRFHLYSNYPNPFNPSTTIRFDIPLLRREELAPVKLEIYNTLGEKVRTLFHGAVEPGVHEVVWDGTTDDGQSVPAGIYYAILKSSQIQLTIKMVFAQ